MMHAVSVYQPEEQDQQQQEEQEKIYEQQQQQEHEKILEQQQQKEREKILEQQKQEEHEKILEQQKQLEREMILEQERQQHEEHEKAEEKEQEQEQEHKEILEQQQEEEQETKQLPEQDVTEPVPPTTTEGPEEYMRNMSVFIRPLEDTILAEPEPGPCSERRLINLVVVVMSAPGNFLERSTIRRTWGEEVLQYPGVTLFFLLGRDRNDSLHVSFKQGNQCDVSSSVTDIELDLAL